MCFVSEEFCAVLNCRDALACDLSARIRTLFTNLVQSDARALNHLVRNSLLKMGCNMGMISENPHRTVIALGYRVSKSNELVWRNPSSTERLQYFWQLSASSPSTAVNLERLSSTRWSSSV